MFFLILAVLLSSILMVFVGIILGIAWYIKFIQTRKCTICRSEFEMNGGVHSYLCEECGPEVNEKMCELIDRNKRV